MTDMTNPLEGLTDLEREQLRYIVEKVQEWPEGALSLWVTCVGCVVTNTCKWVYECSREQEDMSWYPHYSPYFTRAQYDAMKAEIEAQKVPSIDYRAHCEALAELLTIARCPDASCDNNGTTVHETVSTTIGCCGIYLPDGQCCGNGVPEAVQDIEPAPCQWCHERTKALAAYEAAAAQAVVPDGWKLVPVELLEQTLADVRVKLMEAKNEAYPVCCGRPGSECCGDPEPEWPVHAMKIMDTLGPVERKLLALLNASKEEGK